MDAIFNTATMDIPIGLNGNRKNHVVRNNPGTKKDVNVIHAFCVNMPTFLIWVCSSSCCNRVCKSVKYICWVKKDLFGCFR